MVFFVDFGKIEIPDPYKCSVKFSTSKKSHEKAHIELGPYIY